MSLLDLARQDARSILCGGFLSFGTDVTITAPTGETATLEGFLTRVPQRLDPGIGQVVLGTFQDLVLSMGALRAASVPEPRVEAEQGVTPWLVDFADEAGVSRTCTIVDVRPDRTLDIVTCSLRAVDR